jgi:hypothetical protein
MRKTAVFSTLFLAVFGLTLGITLATYQPAAAIVQCSGQCLFDKYCSYDSYPECSGSRPYLVYITSKCIGGPYNCPWYINEPWGCWSGTLPCQPRSFWIVEE